VEWQLEEQTEHRAYRVTFVVLSISVGAYAMLQSLVIPVLATIQTKLHTSQNTVTWVLTAYLLSASIFTPVLGRVGDMVGKKRIFVLSLAALALGSLLAAVASSVEVMIVARVIQGVGGGVLPLTFGIIRDEFPRERVVGAVSAVAALIAVGGGLGIVLAGPIINGLGYAWLFWLPLIIVSVATLAAAALVPESPIRTNGSISIAAGIALSGWLVALLVAVSEATTWGWTSLRVIGLVGVAVVLGFVWLRIEMHTASRSCPSSFRRPPRPATASGRALPNRDSSSCR
jgi:MFS family permease